MSGKELKELVRKAGLSNAEIARRLGTIPQNLNTYYSVSDIKTGTLEKMSKALGVSIAWFYGEEAREQNNADLLDLLKEKDSQIDRLLGIIEAMSGASKKDTE